MYNQVVVRAAMRLHEQESHRASLRKPALGLQTRSWVIPLRTAIVAFVAGWLAASIF